MMRIPWHAALCELRDRLAADPRLARVTIVTGAVDPDSAGPESIQFTEIEETAEWRQVGPLALEATATVTGFIWVVRPGGGEEAIRAARARADELRAVVLETLLADPTIGRTVESARVSGATYDQGVTGDGQRACRVTFRIVLTAHVGR
jgi:hypothetical protein